MKFKRTTSINSCRLHFDRWNLKRRRCFRKRLYSQVQLLLDQSAGGRIVRGWRAGEERRERLSWPRETKPRNISSVTGEYESTSRARSAEQQTTQQQHRARRLTSSSASSRIITNQTSTGSSEAQWGGQAGNTRKGQFVVRFYLRWDDINFEKRCWPKSAHDADKWVLKNARYSPERVIWNSDDSSGLSHADDSCRGKSYVIIRL